MIEEHIERIFKVKRGLCNHNVTVIVIIASTGISMQDIITMNIENRYENRASRTTVNTQIGVSAPQVRLGLLV
jgi:dethiobiotin synthetase